MPLESAPHENVLSGSAVGDTTMKWRRTTMDSDSVVIRAMRALRGPNLYAYMPVLQITLDIGPYEERPSSSFPGLVERLKAWLPGLAEHECSLGRSGGFL